MSIINILLKLSPALEKGQSLANRETWTNVVLIKNALYTVFGFLLILSKQFGYEFPISDTQLITLAGALASIGEPVAAYLHITTNTHAGLVRN